MTWLDLFVKLGGSLILLPFATRYFSSEELAFYLFITTLLNLAYLAEGGINKVILRGVSYFNNGLTSIPNSMDEYQDSNKTDGRPNYIKLGQIVATSLYLYVFLGGVGAIFLICVGGIVAENIISKQVNYENAETAFYLLVAFVFIYIVQLRYIALIQGMNFLAKQKRVELVFGVIRILLLLIAISLGFGILGVVVGLLISVSISSLLYYLMWRSVGPIVEIKEYLHFDIDMLKQIYPAAWKQSIIAWGSYLIYYGTTLIVAQIEDLDLIASYLLTIQIMFLLMSLSSAPVHSRYPEVSNIVANKNSTAYKAFLTKSVVVSLSLYLFGSIFVLVTANPVLEYIGSKTFILDGYLVYFLLFIYFLELHHVIHATIYTATNHIPFVIPALISGVAIIVGGLLIVDTYGLLGIITLQFLVQLCFNNWYPIVLNIKFIKRF